MLQFTLERAKMKVIEVLEDQKEKWNDFIKETGTLLQSWEWGEFKSKFLWKPYRLAVVDDEKKESWTLVASILVRKLPFSKTFLYIGEGPPMAGGTAHSVQYSALSLLFKAIESIAQKENAIFLRVEPFRLDPSSQLIIQLERIGFQKAFESIQPQNRLWIDLTKPEEEILKEMKQKGRYNIKIAYKNDVNIEEATDKEMLEKFYNLHAETARRDKFTIRPKEYFEKLFDTFFPPGYYKLLIAFWKKKPLAAILLTAFGRYVTYLYGASSSQHREVMSAYLIQWEAIKKAKQEGFKIYDFGAIAPSEAPHHWSGLREFKMKFGGHQIDFPGAYDLVYKSLWYGLFKIIEKIRRKET